MDRAVVPPTSCVPKLSVLGWKTRVDGLAVPIRLRNSSEVLESEPISTVPMRVAES